MPKPTDAEIKEELRVLADLATRLPVARRNLKIVIDALAEGMTVDQAYDAYDSEDNEFQYALDTAMWLSGESDTKPSEGWE